MSKQIKISFDKTSPRESTFDQILVDVRGNFLRDERGNFLYTQVEDVSPSFFKENNSMSVSINNEATKEVGLGGYLSVEEQFPQSSEVSNSLLGIPRANQQQSLLADVSVYGLEENTWEFYGYPSPYQPVEWSTRKNRIYGKRYTPRYKEYADQQAISVESFPVPYTYPFGPQWDSQGLYNANLFTRYLRFVETGNILYDYFLSRGYLNFAKTNFLSRNDAQVDGNITLNNGQEADVIYNDDLNIAFSGIENWTMTWMDIRDSKLINPVDNKKITPSFVNSLLSNNSRVYGFDDTQPGYSSSNYYYYQLQSKEAFRYQPGAISGFTFGAKLNTDPSKTENIIEWGCANDTDQLMFQVSGSNLNIIRRSTVPLTNKSLGLNRLTPEDQHIVDVPNPFERDDSQILTDSGEYIEPKGSVYEAVIKSESFNGDPLDGSGDSGYTISFNEVTMYKIEYSWYGAIGAKFYAYIPVGNAECRWVLIHTLLIENSLDKPSLKNPFMHFRYVSYLKDTSSLREPIYLFKYGASYYIDGADEGTYSYNNYKARTKKTITASNSRPVLGFSSKQLIYNRDGIGTESQKNFYVDDISINTDVDSRIDILECEGCRNGYGHFYATSLLNGESSNIEQYTINELGQLYHANTSIYFTEEDHGKKIIGEGIFSSYLDINQTGIIQFADIARRIGATRINNPISSTTYTTNDLIRVGGEDISPIGYTFDGRITGFNDIISSSVPLTKNNIRVHFLCPIKKDALGQYNEFRIGVTPKVPLVEVVDFETNEEKLLFNSAVLNQEEEIYGEFSQYTSSKNAQGVEVGEDDRRYGNMFETDPRIPRPNGLNSGDCSTISFEIRDRENSGVEYRDELILDSGTITGNFIVFETNPSLSVLGGEIGVYDGNEFVSSGIFFTTELETFTESLLTKYYAEISDVIDLSSSIKNGQQTIAFKTIRSFGRFWDKTKVFNFNTYEFYLFISMMDNAQINNIVIEEFDDISTTSHTPDWIVDPSSNISLLNVSVTEDYNQNSGKFEMGGTTFQGNTPSNFIEKNRLDSVKFDDNIELPLRPANFKSSFYVGANQTQKISMDYLFGIDRFKVTKGALNNKTVYFSAKAINSGDVGEVEITVNGKEQ